MSDLLLIDGSLLAYRNHEAMPDLSSSAGVPTGLEYGFLRTIESLQRKYPKFRIVMVWDCPTARSEAAKVDSQYKANRTGSSDKRDMWKRVKALRRRVLENVWPWAFREGAEADTLMHNLAHACPSASRVLLYTNDKDLLQTVVNDRIVLLKSHRSSIYEWDEEKVREEFAVRPWQLPLLRACLGDKSDNLPGCGCLNKGKLAEAVRDASGNIQGICPTPDKLIEYMPTRPNWFGPKTFAKWNAFVESGQLHRNFELMKIKKDIYNPVEIVEPRGEKQPVTEALLEWEIRSLKMCSEFLAGTSLEEEF